MERTLQLTDTSLLRTIIDSSPDWIFIKDLKHRFLLVNEVFARSINLPVEDIIGKNDIEIGIPEEIAKGNAEKGIRGFWNDDDEVTLSGHNKLILEEPVIVAGQECILNTIKVPLTNERGDVWGILVFVHDITLYKQTERALRESEQRYRQLFTTAERTSKELMLLDKLRSAIVDKLELDILFETIVAAISQIFHYERILITFVDADLMLSGPSCGYTALPVGFTAHESIIGKVAKTGQSILIDNSADETLTGDHDFLVSDNTVLSHLSLPFFADGKVAGVLTIETTASHLDKTDLALMMKIAEQINLAVENARLHQQTRIDLLRTKALYQISQALTGSDGLASLLDRIADNILAALAARHVFIYKLDIEMHTIDHVSYASHSRLRLDSMSYNELWQDLYGMALTQQQTIMANPSTAGTAHPAGGSRLVAPLIFKGTPMGVLVALNDQDDRDFDQDDVDTLTAIAHQVVLALEQHQLFDKLEHQAFHDALTNLPNRTLFQDRLQFSIEYARRQNKLFALLFVDLDSFKHINDTLGHHIGDQILQQMSDRLRSQVRTSDTLARMGGDEFALILNDLHTNTDAAMVAEHYLALFKKPFFIEHRELFLTASIGISLFPKDGEDAITLLRHADSAMYQAKNAGRNNVQSFTHELSQQTRRRLDVELELRRAISNHELELYYQPQIDLNDGRVIGFEALLRWNNARYGWISPGEFIPIAEDTGLILEIGDWVLCQACLQQTAWLQANEPPRQIAVNVSPHQFVRSDFVDSVTTAIDGSGIDPTWLELEITESVVMHDITRVAEKLNHLRELGVSIAIDDFGTGYSSLRYLQQLPIDKLKIDQSFMHDIQNEQDKSALIDSFIMLSANLGLKVIAEGVETRAQLAYLKKIGCHQVQGFYFAKPMPARQAASVISYSLTTDSTG